MQAGPQEFSSTETGADFESRVRDLAYELWQQEGEPEGRGDEFWLRAEARIRAEMSGAPGMPDSGPADGHDAAAAQSFPASDPPAATSGIANLRSAIRQDVPAAQPKLDEVTQQTAGPERRKAGGYT